MRIIPAVSRTWLLIQPSIQEKPYIVGAQNSSFGGCAGFASEGMVRSRYVAGYATTAGVEGTMAQGACAAAASGSPSKDTDRWPT
jgi:hypothetical protein